MHGAGERWIILALLLSGLGGLLKLYGGARYGSMAVLVDGVTCVANLVAGMAVFASIRIAQLPPDKDHPFGHRRYIYTGILATVITYSVAAGFNMAVILLRVPEAVGAESSLYAVLGGAVYAGSVAAARRAGVVGASLSMFTFSEVLESLVSAGSALGGALVSAAIDRLGAAVITGYILVEVAGEARSLNRVLVDWAHPRVYERVLRLLEERGLRVESLRIRLYEHGRFQGEAVVRPGRGMPRDVAELLAEEAEAQARMLGVDLSVRVVSPREG